MQNRSSGQAGRGAKPNARTAKLAITTVALLATLTGWVGLSNSQTSANLQTNTPTNPAAQAVPQPTPANVPQPVQPSVSNQPQTVPAPSLRQVPAPAPRPFTNTRSSR